MWYICARLAKLWFPLIKQICFSVEEMDWDSFHNLETIEGYMGWLNATRHEFVTVWPLADTAENRRVYVVRVTDPKVDGPKKRIWIEGGMYNYSFF